MANVKSIETKEMVITAPIGKRIIALLLDILIIFFFIASPFSRLFQNMLPTKESFSESFSFTTFFYYIQSNPAITSKINLISIFMVILALLYFVLLDYLIGQTAGKKIMNIFVKSDTGDLTINQCLIRNLFVIPFFPFVLLWIIDPIYMFMRGQRLTERLSKTRTVQKALIIEGLY